jgi:putative transposase
MKRSKSAQDAQRFLSTLDQVANLFHVPHPKKAPPEERRAMRRRAFAVWHDILKTTAA